MKKVLGIMLLTASTLFIAGCVGGRTTAAGLGTVTFEVYGDAGTLVASETVAFFEGDTLLGLLQDTFEVACGDAAGEPDDTCSYVGPYGVYLVGIEGVNADAANEYIAFYVDGEYAVAGLDQTAITDGSVYAFKLETF